MATGLGLMDESGKEQRFRNEAGIWSCPRRKMIVQVPEEGQLEGGHADSGRMIVNLALGLGEV